MAHVRAVVQTKRHGEGVSEGRDGNLYFLPWVPHRRILPRCSAMVHHGGAGTAHAAARAGIPQIVLPFIFEQKLWAKVLERAGTAEAPISFWKATPDKVAARIRGALGSERLRRDAAVLARAMASEDGTGEATRLIVSLL